jgi:hypothetical protein
MAVRSRCSQCKWAEKNRSVRKISVFLTESDRVCDTKNQRLGGMHGGDGVWGFPNAQASSVSVLT